MKLITKAKEVFGKTAVKAGTMSIAVIAAMQAVAVNAFAADEATVDISSVTTAMTSSLTDLVGKVAIGCAAVVGAGLTIFGIQFAVKKIRGFFVKL